MQQKARRTYLDVLRICAAFLVIFNHLPGYELYQHYEGLETWLYAFITMLTRVNVPIFFMVTGALLLPKQESISTVIKNRVSRILLVLTIFSIPLYVIYHRNYDDFGIVHFIRLLLADSISYAYWFFYAYVSLLLMLPYLQRAVKGMTTGDFIYIVFIHFFFGTFMSIANYVLNLHGIASVTFSPFLQLPLMLTVMLFFPVLGHYLDNVLDIQKLRAKHIAAVIAVGCAGIFISSAITMHQGLRSGFTQDYVQLFDYVTAMALFVVVKYIFENRGFLRGHLRVSNWITSVGRLTLGMYVLDLLWRPLIYDPIMLRLCELPRLIQSFAWCLLSMALSGIVTYLLKKLPVFRKIL